LLSASIVAALLLMLPLQPWRGGPPMPLTTTMLGALAYVGVCASALAFWLWNRGVARLGPVRAAGFMFLMPLYAALLSFVLLGEPVQRHQVVGGSLVLLGLFIAVVTLVGVMAWRNRIMLKLGLRNIPKRPAQTALIILGLMLSTVIITSAFGNGDTIAYTIRSLGARSHAMISLTSW